MRDHSTAATLWAFCLAFCLVLCLLPQGVNAETSVDDYLDLNLEDLLSMEVTSASKKKQRLTDTATAIYVITREDLLRSGVTSLPEALRLAPGIQVARIDSNKWAISSRGFNGQFSNKLLVLMDGRSVYTPSYSGVYWEIQDTVLEDIDRIEVIRGPGATVWGANAVNGVINIITLPASQTQQGLLNTRFGNEIKGDLSLRYGWTFGQNNSARVYLKSTDRDGSYADQLKVDAGDDWRKHQAGFRADVELAEGDQLTLQGDVYHTDENQILRSLWLDPTDPANNPPNPLLPYQALNVQDQFESSGYNLLLRWEHESPGDLHTQLQFYFDHTQRSEQILDQDHNIADVDFIQRYAGWEKQDLVWGIAYRNVNDQYNNSFGTRILPDSRTSELWSGFFQYELSLVPETLRLTLGSKVEHNDYTGTEFQPSIRMLWSVSETQSLWAAMSHAVRTPSRVEDSGSIVTGIIPLGPPAPPGTPPLVLSIKGNSKFKSEVLDAYELGYRTQISSRLSLDMSLFYNQYRNLNTFETVGLLTLPNPIDPLLPPLQIPEGFAFDNRRDATSLGMELSIDWHVSDSWRVKFNYSHLDVSEDTDANSSDIVSGSLVEGSSPKNQWSLYSYYNLSDRWLFDLWLYRNGKLKSTAYSVVQGVDAYTSINARIAWQIRESLELSLVGRNLADNRHREFAAENFITTTEVERSVYAVLRWDF